MYVQRHTLGILNFNNKKYFNEDLYKRYMQLMLHDRNKKMLHKIINEFEVGGVFVAVGILHLIGEQGILEEVFFKQLKEQIKNYSLSDEEFKNIKYLKPWAAFNLIGRPKIVNAPTLERNLLKLAKQRMLHIGSLESMDEIISSLEKLSDNDQLNILRDTICNHKSIIKETKILVDLYVQRDILGILNFNNKKYFDEDLYKRYMQLMLYDRNKKMLHKIINEFEDGGIFVAVGILHLISEQGLLEELSNQEYKLKVIY